MLGQHKRKYAAGLRERAQALRRSGPMYAEICGALEVEIPKSALSHWVGDVLLTPEQRQRIAAQEREAAARGRWR
jgi:hypothetical protein